MDTDPSQLGAPRRMRMATLTEQNEFIELGRALRQHGITDDELQRALDYESADMLRGVLASGRVTVHRLERMRAFARDMLSQPGVGGSVTLTRMDTLFERLRDDVQNVTERQRQQPVERVTDSPGPPRKRAARKRAPARGPKRQFLTPKQHDHLREQVEHLWAVDKRFRNWSLLARIMGLATGQAAKRAYDVSSSTRTLQHLETFLRLHAGFGSRATNAIKAGVPIAELQAHLMAARAAGSDANDANAATAAAPAAQTVPAPQETPAARIAALSTAPDEPPTVDFQQLLDVGNALDHEVKRLHAMARFFDGVTQVTSLPKLVRWQAEQTRDRLWQALQIFAPDALMESTPQPGAATTGEADESAAESGGV